MPVLLSSEMDKVRPGCDGFVNLSNAVEPPLTSTASRHQASDRQYRSHAVNRANVRHWGIGLSLPNPVLDQHHKCRCVTPSFWRKRLGPKARSVAVKLFSNMTEMGLSMG
jgi:hypothetical protein